MGEKLFYLMTVLPSLPNLGEPLAPEDAMARIREESGENMLLLADLLECEAEIEKFGMQHFVLGAKDYSPEFSSRIPESFQEVFATWSSLSEAEWLTRVYAAWFDLIIETGDRTGSGLLKDWAKWEYALRTGLRIERLRIAGSLPGDLDSIIPEFMKDSDELPDHSGLIETYLAFTEPMKAEKFLDQARIDFLRRAAIQYSFETDELVAYMLELRIHNRYARLNPEEGQKILEEVTAL